MAGQLKLAQPERIEVDRKLFENLCETHRKMKCLESAGINNCDAYEIGMQTFYKLEALRDDA